MLDHHELSVKASTFKGTGRERGDSEVEKEGGDSILNVSCMIGGFVTILIANGVLIRDHEDGSGTTQIRW